MAEHEVEALCFDFGHRTYMRLRDGIETKVQVGMVVRCKTCDDKSYPRPTAYVVSIAQPVEGMIPNAKEGEGTARKPIDRKVPPIGGAARHPVVESLEMVPSPSRRVPLERGAQMSDVAEEVVAWSGVKACEEIGITYRQLDYWCRTNLIKPSITDAHGSGTRRMFNAEDMRLLHFVKAMLDAGVHLQVVREVVEDFRNDPPPADSIVVFSGTYDSNVRGAQGGTYKNVRIARSEEELLKIIREVGHCWAYVV